MGRYGKFLLTLAILWSAGCSGGQSSTSSGTSTGIKVSVFPSATSVVLGQTVPFSATVTGTTNTAVNWEVAGVRGGNATVGTINTVGLYTAPNVLPNPTTVVVTAVSQADTTKTGTGRVQVFQSNPNQNAQSLPSEAWELPAETPTTRADGFAAAARWVRCLCRNGSFYILSNNHVLARSDQALPGEPISQPGIIETNCSTIGTNTVANLTSFVNLQASGTNVDAAIALIVPGAVDLTGNILLLGGTATGSTPDAGPPHQGRGILASVGKQVAKSGRTTGLTCSTVAATNLSTSVTYQTLCNGGTTFSVAYRNQISVSGGGFSAGGDSGSLIVDQLTADPVALLYGGSDTDTVGQSGGRRVDRAGGSAGEPAFVRGQRVDAPGDRLHVGGRGGEGGGTGCDRRGCRFAGTGATGARFACARVAGESLYICGGRGSEHGSSGRSRGAAGGESGAGTDAAAGDD